MAAAIADIIASLSNAFAPGIEIEFIVELYVRAAEADALAVDAWKIGLAANARAEADVESLIPHVQFQNVRRGHQGKQIYGWNGFAVGPFDLVGDINDVFVCANAIKRRDVVSRQLG